MLRVGGAQAAHRVPEFAYVRVRLRAVDGEMEREVDPTNGAAVKRPSETYPWYFNVCRQRVCGNGAELSAFSPSGRRHFHNLMKLAELYVK